MHKIKQQLDEWMDKTLFLNKKLAIYKEKLGNYTKFSVKKILEYERKWRYLKEKYNHIYVYGIEYVSIGETIPRFFNLIEDASKSKESNLHVVLPTFFDSFKGGIFNRKLMEILARKIYIIKDGNVDFWTYVFGVHAKEISLELFDKYVPTRPGVVKCDLYQSLIPLKKKECLVGAEKLRMMGVTKTFICVHARESVVKDVDFGKSAGYESSCRNWNLDTFYLTSRYLNSQGIQSVRLGKYEKKQCMEETIIDYANCYYDEFMDFYLLTKAKFLVSGDTGVIAIGAYCGCPVLEVNTICLVYGGENRADTGYDMYIPKKFYSQKEKRYLNLYEMFDIVEKCDIYTSNFKKMGIVLEDNTEEEIMNATIEMNQRLDGNWCESEEEMRCYEKYWRIMEAWRKKHKNIRAKKRMGWDGYTMNYYKISYSYLKNNLYLLDVMEK